jgi:hypothetical protein
MFKLQILPKVSSEGNERHLKFKDKSFCVVIFLRCLPQRNRAFCVGKILMRCGIKAPMLWDKIEGNFSNIRVFSTNQKA